MVFCKRVGDVGRCWLSWFVEISAAWLVFVDSQSTLESLIYMENICHQRLLSEDIVSNRQAFRKTYHSVAKALRQAKGYADHACGGGGGRGKKDGWVCWKHIQNGSRKRWGPVTMSVVLDKQGNLIDYVDVPCVRAARQFQGILNIPSHFNPFAINDEPSHEDWGHLDLDHIFWELKSAILRMRRGTALCYQAFCQVLSPVAERLYLAVYTHWWSTFGRYRMFQMIGTTLRSSLRSVIFILPPLSKTSLRVCSAFDWCPSNQFTTPQESDCQYGEY